MIDAKSEKRPPWASLICPFRSTSHMLAEPQVHGVSAIAGPTMHIRIIPADVPCLGPKCAIFESCKPGGLQVAEGDPGMGGSE